MSAAVVAGEVVPALPAGASVLELPGVHAGSELEQHLAGWLGGYAKNGHTFDAYRRDITMWLDWCDRYAVDPIRASKAHVELWHTDLARTPLARTGKVPAPASLARWVSSAASWFAYLLDMDVIGAVPIRKKTRPKAPDESSTVGLTLDEGTALEVRCLEHEHVRDTAVILTLRYSGVRVSELVGLDLGDAVPEEGQAVVLQVFGKGGKPRKVPLAAPAAAALDTYLQWRAGQAGIPLAELLEQDGPLFVAAGGGRFNRRSITRMVQRIARAAGIGSWARLSPHSLRHALATNLLDEGVGLDVVQDILGHASPVTTRRYDRARGKISRTAAGVGLLAAASARKREERKTS